MKQARADAIMWSCGRWTKPKSKRTKPRWISRIVYGSRLIARYSRKDSESVRRVECYFVDV